MVQSNNEFLQGLHIDNLQRKVGDVAFDANLARDSANKAENRADRAEDRNERALMGILQLKQNVDTLNKRVSEKDQIINQKEAEIKDLKDKLAISEAGYEGIKAQRSALKEYIPSDAHIFADSGERFSDGSIKSNMRIIFEKAFDAAARKFGITNPSSRRVN